MERIRYAMKKKDNVFLKIWQIVGKLWANCGTSRCATLLGTYPRMGKNSRWCNDVVNMPFPNLSQLLLDVLQPWNSKLIIIWQKTIKFISLNIKYVVFVVYSVEYRLKRIFKSLYFVFIYILHNFPTSTELTLYMLLVCCISPRCRECACAHQWGLLMS